jgi:putative flippase GtrA
LKASQLTNFIKKFINRETISYLIVGGLTTGLSWGLFVLILHLNGGAVTANNIANAAAILFAFITNKIFVFRAVSWTGRALLREGVTFFSSRLFTHILETVALFILVDHLGLPGLYMKAATMVIIQVAGNYVLSKWVVFVKK